MTANDVQKKLEQHLPGAQVMVQSEDNVHFFAEVISDVFVGLNRVQQQQKIYAILADDIDSGDIHALQLKTKVPQS